MQKERLTRENLTKDIIVSELKRHYLKSLKQFAFLSVFCFMGISLIWAICTPIKDIVILLCLLIVTGFFLAVVGNAVSIIYRYFTCSKTYRIVTDELISSGPAHVDFPTRFGRGYYHAFRFAVYGKFSVDGYSALIRNEYYPYSRKYCMLSDQLIKESCIGDKFYLLINGKQIINVFNTKMFQLIDE